MFITLDPLLKAPEPISLEKLESLEEESVVKTVAAWTAELRKRFSQRAIQPLVISTEARTCLVTRFIRPLNPPTEVLQSAVVMQDKMVRPVQLCEGLSAKKGQNGSRSRLF